MYVRSNKAMANGTTKRRIVTEGTQITQESEPFQIPIMILKYFLSPRTKDFKHSTTISGCKRI